MAKLVKKKTYVFFFFQEVISDLPLGILIAFCLQENVLNIGFNQNFDPKTLKHPLHSHFKPRLVFAKIIGRGLTVHHFILRAPPSDM